MELSILSFLDFCCHVHSTDMLGEDEYVSLVYDSNDDSFSVALSFTNDMVFLVTQKNQIRRFKSLKAYYNAVKPLKEVRHIIVFK